MPILKDIASVLVLNSLLGNIPFCKNSNIFAIKLNSVISVIVVVLAAAAEVYYGARYKDSASWAGILLALIWGITTCYSIYQQSYVNQHYYLKLIKQFYNVDKNLLTVHQVSARKIENVAAVLFLTYLTYCAIYITCFCYFHFYVGEDATFLVFPFVKGIFMVAEFLLQTYIIISLANRLSAYNTAILNMIQSYRRHYNIDMPTNLILIYKELMEIVDHLNDLYCWRWFINVFQLVGGILYCIYYSIAFSTGYTLYAVVVYIPFLHQLVTLFILTHSCEYIRSVAYRTHLLSKELVITFMDNQKMKQYADVLVQQMVMPKFYVGYIFELSYSMLFQLFNLTASYVLVLIQFIKE